MNVKKRMDTARARLNLGYALLLGMLLLLAAVVVYESHRISAVNLERQMRATNLVELTDDLQVDLLNMETGKRGYLLKGQREFLQPYRMGRKNFEEDIAEARKINNREGDPVVDPRLIQDLEKQYETLSALFEKQIAIRGDGVTDPEKLRLSEGKAEMDLARQILGKLHQQALESRSDARQSTRNAIFGDIFLAAGLGSLALLTGIAAFIYVRRSVVHPLQSLRDDALSASRLLETRGASEDLENGTAEPDRWEWQDPASVNGAAEFREVRQAFGALVSQLGLQTQRVRSLVASIEDPLVTVDTEGRIAYFNAAAARLTGFDPGEVKGRLFAEPTVDSSDALPSVTEAMTTRKPVSRPEEILCRKDGGEIYVASTASPLLGEDGSVVGGLKIMRDITERKRAEEKLRAFSAELQRSNRELQDFAHVASHDLQEPLRKVRAFGDRLKVRYADKLDERGLDYIERMQSAAGRMQNLIEDLLTFSRVTTRAKPFEKVDLSQVIREVLSDLETQIERTGGRVEMEELPAIDADPTQMRQLFQNLISNALKFHREDEPPTVKVGGSLSNGVCEISVQDSGIGFEQSHAERIFTIFERLHGRSEYEGTGVGLAVCKKIAERHGGTITARSAPGEGATFIIALPAIQSTQKQTTGKAE